MPLFNVNWFIQIDAETPVGAALEARKIQLDPDSWADHFTVTNEDGDTVGVHVNEHEPELVEPQ